MDRSLHKKMRFEIKYVTFYLKEFVLMKLEVMYCSKQLVHSYSYLRIVQMLSLLGGLS